MVINYNGSHVLCPVILDFTENAMHALELLLFMTKLVNTI